MAAIPRFVLPLTDKEIAEINNDLKVSALEKKYEIERFEKIFASYVRKKFAIFLPSARYGLYQILRGLDLKKGDWIIVPAWTHSSVPATIVAAGFKPLFVDIEGGTYNMSANTIQPEHWKKAKAMIMTHLYGCPAPAEELVEMAKQHNVIVIEDCAQALGATIHGSLTGSFGKASFFSLSITKNLTTLKGGIVCTDDLNLANFIRNSRSDSFIPSMELQAVLDTAQKANKFLKPAMFNNIVYPGLVIAAMVGKDPIHDKFRETFDTSTPPDRVPLPHPVQAILGQRKLAKLDKHNEARNSNGKFLLDNLKGIKGVIIPRFNKGHYHIFMSFVLMVEDPWKVKKALLQRGVDTSPGYLVNNAAADLFKDYNVRCKMAEKLEAMQIHIPVYPGLEKDHLIHIAKSIVDVCAK